MVRIAMNNGILLASYVINAVWQIALIVVSGSLLARLLRRFSPQAEHILYVLTLASAVFLPAKSLLQAIFLASFHSRAATAFLFFAPVASPDNASRAEGVFTLSPATIGVIAFLYIASFCYFSAKLLWSLRCTAKLLQSASHLKLPPAHEQALHKCLEEFKMKAPSVLNSSGISGPVVLELRGSILLVPPDFATNCAAPEFLAALAHEFAHIQRRDFAKNICYEAMSLFVAFHPAIWLIKAQIAQSREMICDRMATEKVVAPGAYARSLLSLASMVVSISRAPSANPIGMFDGNILEKRIMMLNSKNRHINPLAKFGLATLASLFVLAISVAASKASIAVEASQMPPQNESVSAGPIDHVYKVGKDVSAPVPIKTPNAEFPEAAKRAKEPINAVVLVGLVVDAEGMPRQLKIARSFRKDFDAEALKAVEQYRFTPGKRAGKPVATPVNIEVHFKWY
jgi:TonB family protein